MSNYRHSFHAGNAADVLKHIVLLQLVRRLQHKPAPFCYVETHAGRGSYALDSGGAARTCEFQRGIARLWPLRGAAGLPPALADYLARVAELNRGDELRLYPGSPRLVRAVLRPDDRMILCELHPAEVAALRDEFSVRGERGVRRDPQVAIHQRDGYEALTALLPPTPRRGLVLIDPPYERPDEYTAALAGLAQARRRWPQACAALWYPIKGPIAATLLHAAVLRSGLRDVLCVELRTRPDDPDVLTGSGLLLAGAPWQTDTALRALLPSLAAALAEDEFPGDARVDWLVPP
jgi:23S rRNA (adenine2030-N6)-methyltransferase